MTLQTQFSWRISLTASIQHARDARQSSQLPRVPHPLWKALDSLFTLQPNFLWASGEGNKGSRSDSSEQNSKVSNELGASSESCLERLAIDESICSQLQVWQAELEHRIKPIEQEWRAKGPGATKWLRTLLNSLPLSQANPDSNSSTIESEIKMEPVLPYFGGFHAWNATRQTWFIEPLLHDVDPVLPEWLRLLHISLSHHLHIRSPDKLLNVLERPQGPTDRANLLAICDLLTLAAAQWVEAARLSKQTLLAMSRWSRGVDADVFNSEVSESQHLAIRESIWNSFPEDSADNVQRMAQWLKDYWALG